MTANEKQLLSQMQSALSGEPAIAQGQSWSALTEDATVTVFKPYDKNIIQLTGYRGGIIELTPDQFRALNEFAVKCGWQCD